MLTLKAFNIDSPVPTLGVDFVLGHIEVLSNTNLRLWFTRQPSNANDPSKYSISGPTSPVIAIAQLATFQQTAPYLAVNLFTATELVVGQYTLSVSGTLETDNGGTATQLGATQVVFDLVEEIAPETASTLDGPVSVFLPNKFKGKRNLSALTDAIEYGDSLVREQLRDTFDAASITTATGDRLLTKISDIGVEYNYKLGFDDETLRGLAISVHNNKLTNFAISSVLETLYGLEATHGYLESGYEGPFKIFDGATLNFVVDGRISTEVTLRWEDYKNPLQATVGEMSHTLNLKFEEMGSNAIARVAETANGDRLRIFSKSKGLISTISCVGGTFLPFLQLNNKVSTSITFVLRNDPTWIITNPRPGIARFQTDPAHQGITPFTNLHIGDFVVITGEEFEAAVRGTHRITNVYTYVSINSVLQWFEIESSAYDA